MQRCKHLFFLISLFFTTSLCGMEDTPPNEYNEYVKAIKKGKTKSFLPSCFKHKDEINVEDNDKRSALMNAIIEGNDSIIKTLMINFSEQLEINSKCSLGNTALHYAACSAYYKKSCIEFLIADPRLDLEIKNKKRQTVFDIAEGNKDLLKILDQRQKLKTITCAEILTWSEKVKKPFSKGIDHTGLSDIRRNIKQSYGVLPSYASDQFLNALIQAYHDNLWLNLAQSIK